MATGCLCLGAVAAHAQANSYDKKTSGRWEKKSNWSLHLAPASTQSIFITNENPKTVTISDATARKYAATLTVANLELAAPNGSINTLLVDNADEPLDISRTLIVDHGGALRIQDSAVQSDVLQIDGEVTLTTNAASPAGAVRTQIQPLAGGGGGILRARNVVIGSGGTASKKAKGSRTPSQQPETQGTLTIADGTVAVSENLTVGDCGLSAEGVINVAGGSLVVANESQTATFDIRDGTCNMRSGQIAVDTLVMTNACGAFVWTGGSVTATTLILDPELDADGDGLPNGWEQMFGLNPLSVKGNNGADGDPDGDGFTNLQEFTAGTDPLDPSSHP